MAHAIRMPKPGQMDEECVLVAWHKAEGEAVRRGDVLFEIETDKSIMDVEAFDDGILLRRDAEEGAVVPVNAIVAYVGEIGEPLPDAVPLTVPANVAAAATPAATAASPGADPSRPLAVAGSPGTAATPTPRPRAPEASEGTWDASPSAPISPRAARAAAAAGLDPRDIVGTGPNGRIVERDVLAAISAAEEVTPPAPEPGSVPTEGSTDAEGPRPLSRMRQTIARRMSESAAIPQFQVTVAVDLGRVQAIRDEAKAAGTHLSITDFVLHATAQTLAEFPEVNARTDGRLVWPRRRVHLGVAVSVPGGLVVAVIRDADRRTLADLRAEAATLAERAREGLLQPDDMTGSTFTVSNLGMFGVDEFAALINPGEAAILAVGSVTPTPVAVDAGIAVRPVMKVTLSADHRLVDGELAARFLNALRRRLQDREGLRRAAFDSEE